MCTLLQIHANFLATFQRIMTTFNQVTGGGVVYSGATGKLLPPWIGGQGCVYSAPGCAHGAMHALQSVNCMTQPAN